MLNIWIGSLWCVDAILLICNCASLNLKGVNLWQIKRSVNKIESICKRKVCIENVSHEIDMWKFSCSCFHWNELICNIHFSNSYRNEFHLFSLWFSRPRQFCLSNVMWAFDVRVYSVQCIKFRFIGKYFSCKYRMLNAFEMRIHSSERHFMKIPNVHNNLILMLRINFETYNQNCRASFFFTLFVSISNDLKHSRERKKNEMVSTEKENETKNDMRMQNDIQMEMMRNIIPFYNHLMWFWVRKYQAHQCFCSVIYDFIIGKKHLPIFERF